jgi:hypothetical protein
MPSIQLHLQLSQPCLLESCLQWAIESRECSVATLTMHEAHARYLLEWFRNIDVRTIDYPRIREWMRTERKRGLAWETIKKRLCTLKLAMLEAVARRELERLPQWPEIQSDTRAKTGFWTHDHLQAALEVIETEDFATWVWVGWWSGMHASDIDRFRWQDVDLTRKLWVRRNHKTKVPPADLPLPDGWLAQLQERYERRAPHKRDLVSQLRFGHPNAHLKRVCLQAGVPMISTIGLRHSCESYLEEKGASELFQQTWLGLTSPRMLKRHYRHITPVGLEAGIAAVNAPRSVASE